MKLPEKFEDRMKKMLGDEYDDFIKSMDETPIFTGIRINTSKVGAKDAVIKEFGEPCAPCAAFPFAAVCRCRTVYRRSGRDGRHRGYNQRVQNDSRR